MPSMREINKLGRANYALGKYVFTNQLEAPGISNEEIIKIKQDLNRLEDLNNEREKVVRRYYIRKVGEVFCYAGSIAAGCFIGTKVSGMIFKK